MTTKPICLRCKKKYAYAKKNFVSAWCPECHLEKFGCTHEERKAGKAGIKKLPANFKIVP